MKKKNIVALVNRFSALNSKESLTKPEMKELRSIRRTLESCGLDPTCADLMDRAIILDNKAQVEGYLSRSTNAEMYYAKRSNGKNVGKIKANQLEANALKELGLSTVDPKRLSKAMLDIASYKKAVERKKHTTRKISNIRLLNQLEYERDLRDFDEPEEAYFKDAESFDPDEITAFATRVFLPV